MSDSERRREQRYVVDAVHLAIGPHRFPVIDIAFSGARISCTPGEYERLAEEPCRLEFGSEPPYEVFAVEPHLVRATNLYIVIGYEPLRTDWQAYIRRFDSFRVHELDAQLFE